MSGGECTGLASFVHGGVSMPPSPWPLRCSALDPLRCGRARARAARREGELQRLIQAVQNRSVQVLRAVRRQHEHHVPALRARAVEQRVERRAHLRERGERGR